MSFTDNKGKKILAYAKIPTSLRWQSSFLLKPVNEFPAIVSSLNMFNSLMSLLLKKNITSSFTVLQLWKIEATIL